MAHELLQLWVDFATNGWCLYFTLGFLLFVVFMIPDMFVIKDRWRKHKDAIIFVLVLHLFLWPVAYSVIYAIVGDKKAS